VAVARRIECRVSELVAHGERVYSIVLQPRSPIPRFLPGQFLHLALDAADPQGFWPESRVFSIASPPDDREAVRITYSVKGAFTSRMERELAVGSSVWIKLPYGSFIVDQGSSAVLFAGGTGVTAFTAFLGALESDHPWPVRIHYGARTNDLFVYRAHIEAVAARVPNVQATFVSEAEDGRLSVDRAWSATAELKDPVIYLSGPPAMIAALSRDLSARGVPPSAIRIDAWE
jgi:ferredoxin-NADP reductase